MASPTATPVRRERVRERLYTASPMDWGQSHLAAHSATHRRSADSPGHRMRAVPASTPPIDPPRADSASGPALVARGIGRRLQGRTILDAVDLEVAPGERVAILGPNGAGKTTLLEVLAGVQPAQSGTVEPGPTHSAGCRSGQRCTSGSPWRRTCGSSPASRPAG